MNPWAWFCLGGSFTWHLAVGPAAPAPRKAGGSSKSAGASTHTGAQNGCRCCGSRGRFRRFLGGRRRSAGGRPDPAHHPGGARAHPGAAAPALRSSPGELSGGPGRAPRTARRRVRGRHGHRGGHRRPPPGVHITARAALRAPGSGHWQRHASAPGTWRRPRLFHRHPARSPAVRPTPGRHRPYRDACPPRLRHRRRRLSR